MGRAEKYRAKISGDLAKQKYDATKDIAVKAERAYFASAVELEEKIKQVVSGEPSIYHHFYIAFAEEIVKKNTQAEVMIVFNKWRMRGLRTEILYIIINLLKRGFINICRFDQGRFDQSLFG